MSSELSISWGMRAALLLGMLTIGSFFASFTELRYLAFGSEADGTITGTRLERSRRGTRYVADFSYQVLGRGMRNGQDTISADSELLQGDRVKIQYVGSTSRLAGPVRWGGPVTFVICLLITLGLFVREWWLSEQREKAIKSRRFAGTSGKAAKGNAPRGKSPR